MSGTGEFHETAKDVHNLPVSDEISSTLMLMVRRGYLGHALHDAMTTGLPDDHFMGPLSKGQDLSQEWRHMHLLTPQSFFLPHA